MAMFRSLALGILVVVISTVWSQFCIPYHSGELHPFDQYLCGDPVNSAFGLNFSRIEGDLQTAKNNSNYLRGGDLLLLVHKFLHWCEHEQDAVNDLFYNVHPRTTPDPLTTATATGKKRAAEVPHGRTRRSQVTHVLNVDEMKDYVNLMSGLPPSCLQRILELHIGWVRGMWLALHPWFLENNNGTFIG